MSQPTCRGCGQVIRWLKTRSGQSMPCDPGKLIEWVTDTPSAASTRRITLLDLDGDTHTGYLASVLTPGSRQIDGSLSHFSSCPKAGEFRRRETPA